MPANPFQLALLKIPVTDVDRSAAFYTQALGFELDFIVAEYGWAQLRAGDLPLALYQPGMGGGDGPVGGSVDFHLTIGPDPFDALAATLLPQGVLGENRVHHGDDGSTFFELRDPDGNVLKIVRTPPPGA